MIIAAIHKKPVSRITLLSLLAVFLTGQIIGPIYALSPKQKNLLDTGIYYFDERDSSSNFGVCLGGAGGGGPLYGPAFPQVSDTAALAAAIKDYISKARPDSPLADFAESYVTLGLKYKANPALLVAMSQKETSLGTAGYGTPSGGYNITNLRPGGNFARYSSYNQAIEAAYKNLAGDLYLGPPSNFTTIEQVINRWAPPSENDTSLYIRQALDIIQQILGKLSGGEASAALATTCNQASGLVDSEGYAFPVAPQRKSQNSGVNAMSPLPCSGTCHHWESSSSGNYAFDISRKPGGEKIAGAAVYAISDGKVDMVHVYRGIAGCYSLQMQSSKDNYWYYYTHIQNVKVKSGDIVKGGAQIAEIGPNKCTGNGSDAHLHIDRGCVIGGIPQKGGRESCRDGGIISLVNGLFGRLPE